MDINISEANQFINLHAHPQAIKPEDLSQINDWISRYPYCQSLHFLAAQATSQTPDAEAYLAKAATFSSSREVLFQFVNHTENFESESVLLDESLNTANEITEIIEPRDDLGQAFGADLNYYKIDEANAEENSNEITETFEDEVNDGERVEEVEVVEGQAETEEPVEETQNIEEPVAEENEVEIPVEEEQTQHTEPVKEIQNVEETIAEEKVEEIPLEEEQTQIEEPVEEIQNVEETITEENVEETPVEEEQKTQIEEPVEETQNIEETVAEENVEDISVEEEQTQIEKQAEETQNIQETVAEENLEETSVEEEQTQSEEPVEEIQNIEETVAEENVEETPPEEEQTQSEEPVEEIQNIEEIVVEENFEETPLEEEKTQSKEPVEEIQNVEETIAEEKVEEIPVEEVQTQNTEPVEEKDEVKEKEAGSKAPAQEDELIFDSPIASDFFAFAKSEKPNPQPTVAQQAKPEEKPIEATKEELSQYNDERLPYTFLWWLNKTRKEHASNTQPYVKTTKPAPPKKENVADQSLNHQIAENIFHLRGAEEIGATASQNQTVPFDFRKKEFQIIEKFIKEEPQIKPPAANKIDSENKAKKSSEDTNEVVSETLAKIYVEQILYHKALDVYKKLSLKYPEKSTYFASQIKYLELKVN